MIPATLIWLTNLFMHLDMVFLSAYTRIIVTFYCYAKHLCSQRERKLFKMPHSLFSVL